MYNKAITEFGFCDIRNNQGLGECNQPRPTASADYTCLDLGYSGYHKNPHRDISQLYLDLPNTKQNSFFD